MRPVKAYWMQRVQISMKFFLRLLILIRNRVRKIVLSLAGHLKLFAGHLIEFNYSSSPDISKISWTRPASSAN